MTTLLEAMTGKKPKLNKRSRTLFEARGWHPSYVFRIKPDSDCDYVRPGSTFTIDLDDGSDCPLFALLDGECDYNNARGGRPGIYIHLDQLERI